MVQMIRSLNFDETPKYFWFRNLLTSLFIKGGFVYDGVFDWDDEAAIHRPDPSVYLSFCAGRYQRLNERQIKVRKEGIVFPNDREMFLHAGRVVS
jgi:hypothetical protein